MGIQNKTLESSTELEEVNFEYVDFSNHIHLVRGSSRYKHNKSIHIHLCVVEDKPNFELLKVKMIPLMFQEVHTQFQAGNVAAFFTAYAVAEIPGIPFVGVSSKLPGCSFESFEEAFRSFAFEGLINEAADKFELAKRKFLRNYNSDTYAIKKKYEKELAIREQIKVDLEGMPGHKFRVINPELKLDPELERLMKKYHSTDKAIKGLQKEIRALKKELDGYTRRGDSTQNILEEIKGLSTLLERVKVEGLPSLHPLD